MPPHPRDPPLQGAPSPLSAGPSLSPAVHWPQHWGLGLNHSPSEWPLWLVGIQAGQEERKHFMEESMSTVCTGC